MKKIALIACIASIGLAFTSCKKRYSCDCIEIYQDDSFNYNESESYTIIASKKDKQSECKKYEAYQTMYGSTRTCTVN